MVLSGPKRMHDCGCFLDIQVALLPDCRQYAQSLDPTAQHEAAGHAGEPVSGRGAPMIRVKPPMLAEEDQGTVTMIDVVTFADVFMSTAERV
jgi:hypothetical protein